MTVTSVESLTGKKNKVFIDRAYAFMLYDRDLSIYKLEEGCEISEALYDRIIAETVLRRAKQKALAILERADHSEAEIRRKLKNDMHTEDIIDKAIEYINGYHYINDLRYAVNYIRTYAGSRSRRELFARLSEKGISKDTAEEAFEQFENERAEEEELERKLKGVGDDSDKEILSTELQAAVNVLRKKLCGRTSVTCEEKNKIMAFMFRKGYRSEDINNAFEILNIDTEGGEKQTNFF